MTSSVIISINIVDVAATVLVDIINNLIFIRNEKNT